MPVATDLDDLLGIGRQRSNSAPPSDIPLPLDSAAEEADPDAGGAGGLTARRAKKKGRSITVLARFRPENAQELANGGRSIVKYFPDNSTVEIKVDGKYAGDTGTDNYQFRFDRIFPSYSTQADLWQYVGEPVVDNVFNGVNCSVMAYGQTGSGKTYSMMGVVNERTHTVTDSPGLIPRIFTALFQRAADLELTHEVSITMNFVELYMERLYDLLIEAKYSRSDAALRIGWFGPSSDSEKLEIHDGGKGTVFIKGCTTAKIGDAASALEVVQRGLRLRSTAATSSNLQSSRSHAVVLVTITTKDLVTMVESQAQLYLVDLAGSEKVAKTEASGLRLDEATSINLSLHALGNVITALAHRQTSRKMANMHIPFRNSKLTRLLENSLGGNALTFVVLTVSPNSFNDTETLATMRFGAKAQLITTKPKRNQTRTVEELEMLLEAAQREIADLKTQCTLLKRQLFLGDRAGGEAAVGSPANAVVLHLGNNGGRPNTSGGRLTAAPAAPAAASNVRALSAMVRRNEAALASLIGSAVTCPLTGRPMKEPVVCLDGHTYERRAIQQHLLQSNMISPLTGEMVQMNLLIPNQLMRTVISMCNDGSLLAVDSTLAPTAIWQVPDVLGLVLDFVPEELVLRFARVNANFARAAYDKRRWREAISRLLRVAPLQLVAEVNNTTLPAHKVYMLLSKGGVGVHKQLKSLEYVSATTVALYSSTIRALPKKAH